MAVSIGLSGAAADAETERVALPEAFGRRFNEALVHQAVVAYLAGGRQGSRAQKTRAEVRGGGRKPWRQKRTGRARAGSIRSPLWRGGGRTFAARPQDHALKLNRKMYRGALQCIFSELLRQDRLQAFPATLLALDAPKTRLLAAALAGLGLQDALVVVDKLDRNLELAARNLPRIEVCAVAGVNPVNLMRHEQVAIAVEAVPALEARLQ